LGSVGIVIWAACDSWLTLSALVRPKDVDDSTIPAKLEPNNLEFGMKPRMSLTRPTPIPEEAFRDTLVVVELDDSTAVPHAHITDLEATQKIDLSTLVGTYEGELDENAEAHGWGRKTFACGEVYEGQFQHGKRHGSGQMTCEDVGVYDGQYQNDQRHGHGTMTRLDGQMYEGEWQKGRKHGWGMKVWAHGATYEGEWQNDKRHGCGQMKYPSGEVQDGEWLNDNFDKTGI